MAAHQRLLSIDILRGITIVGMILVNNPGGGWTDVFVPLMHADWIGLTPADLVFPTFMFIMGITTCLSLRKYDFAWSKACACKIARRALLLWAVGLFVTMLFDLVGYWLYSDHSQSLFAAVFGHLRLLGVLPRLGICYGLAALIAITVRHRLIPWLIVFIFVGYWIILECGNGYAHDATNILAVADRAVLGPDHVFLWDTPDPEGVLSTLPALAHVLIGFCVGRMLTSHRDLHDRIERLFVVGALLMTAGALLAYLCPVSKKIWTPTFAMLSCGIAATLLALLTWMLTTLRRPSAPSPSASIPSPGRVGRFFLVFGVNPLALYVLSELLVIPFAMLPVCGGETVQQVVFSAFAAMLPVKWASLVWAVLCVLACWAVGCWLQRRQIYIKL